MTRAGLDCRASPAMTRTGLDCRASLAMTRTGLDCRASFAMTRTGLDCRFYCRNAGEEVAWGNSSSYVPPLYVCFPAENTRAAEKPVRHGFTQAAPCLGSGAQRPRPGKGGTSAFPSAPLTSSLSLSKRITPTQCKTQNANHSQHDRACPTLQKCNHSCLIDNNILDKGYG